MLKTSASVLLHLETVTLPHMVFTAYVSCVLVMKVVAAAVKYERDLEPVMNSAKTCAVDETLFYACRFGGRDEQEVLNLELVLFCQQHKASD